MARRVSREGAAALAKVRCWVDLPIEERGLANFLRDNPGCDPLTGLPGRFWLREWLEREILLDQARTFAALLLDIDNFRAINDGDDHAQGDAVLLGLVRRLHQALPDETALARLGGDEFCVLLPGRDLDSATLLARRLLQLLEDPFQCRAGARYISCSIGIAGYPCNAASASDLIGHADIALHHGKACHRGGISHYRPEMRRRAESHLEMQMLLRDALRTGSQLSLHFQPQFSLPDGQVCGVEALLRWTHPDRGEIPPGCFISATESGGLIGQLGDWVLAEACRCAHELRSAGWPLRIAVNVSALQLRGNDLVAKVRAELSRFSLFAGSIEIELTESAVIENSESAAETMRQLDQIGVRTTIDDFGTGFSSLAYLGGLPVAAIKIDRSFVQQLDVSEKGRKLVNGLVQLAHDLELSVLAEGVETKSQLALLSDYGCDAYQGWLTCRALPLPDLLAFLASHGTTQATTGGTTEENGAFLTGRATYRDRDESSVQT